MRGWRGRKKRPIGSWLYARVLLIGYPDRYPVQRKRASGGRGYVDDAYPETGVGEITHSPRTTPCIGSAAEDVRSCRRSQCGCTLRRRPCRTAIPGELRTHHGRVSGAADFCVQADFNAFNSHSCRQANIVVEEVMFVLASVGARCTRVSAAVGINREETIQCLGISRGGLESVVVASAVDWRVRTRSQKSQCWAAPAQN